RGRGRGRGRGSRCRGRSLDNFQSLTQIPDECMKSLSTILVGALVYFILKSIYRRMTLQRLGLVQEQYQEISIGQKSVPHGRVTKQNKNDHESTSETRSSRRRAG